MSTLQVRKLNRGAKHLAPDHITGNSQCKNQPLTLGKPERTKTDPSLSSHVFHSSDKMREDAGISIKASRSTHHSLSCSVSHDLTSGNCSYAPAFGFPLYYPVECMDRELEKRKVSMCTPQIPAG